MRIYRLCIGLILLLAVGVPQISADVEEGKKQGAPSGGTVSGTIHVWKTKVKTEGPTSDKDVVVFLEKVGEKVDFPAPTEHAKLDQEGMVFVPHVLAVQKGTTVDVLNSDSDRHNVYFVFDHSGETLDLGTWKPGELRGYSFENSDVAITLCKLHLEMVGYVVVLESPFFTVASIDGEIQQASYTIQDVPPGKYVLKTWHKKLKLKDGGQEIAVESGKTTTLDVTITKAK